MARPCLAAAAAGFVLAIVGAVSLGAQEPETRLVARVVLGVACQTGVFGDEGTETASNVGLAIAGQLWVPWSDAKAVVVEGALQPTGLANPFFDERVRIFFVQAGPEFGRRTYVRPSAGLALRFWSGSRASDNLDAAFAVGVAVGRRVPVAARAEISPEFVLRITGGPGAVNTSVGVQVPIGLRARSVPDVKKTGFQDLTPRDSKAAYARRRSS